MQLGSMLRFGRRQLARFLRGVMCSHLKDAQAGTGASFDNISRMLDKLAACLHGIQL